MIRTKTFYAGAALATAMALGLLSFLSTGTVTGNMLILVAQFLMYSLTLAGFGEVVKFIIKTMSHEQKQVEMAD